MKKLIILCALVAMSATVAKAVITGSKHDFSGKTWNTEGEICNPCHAPHDVVVNDMLWNHAETSVTGTYTVAGAGGQPGATSKLCLSCHDGTTAIDSYGSNNDNGTKQIGSGDMVNVTGTTLTSTTGDLTKEHPIGVLLPAIAAGSWKDASTTLGLTNGTDNVECSSCHDVHNQGEAGASNLLVLDNASSALCLACHDK